jgi:hypothetical protein
VKPRNSEGVATVDGRCTAGGHRRGLERARRAHPVRQQVVCGCAINGPETDAYISEAVIAKFQIEASRRPVSEAGGPLWEKQAELDRIRQDLQTMTAEWRAGKMSRARYFAPARTRGPGTPADEPAAEMAGPDPRHAYTPEHQGTLGELHAHRATRLHPGVSGRCDRRACRRHPRPDPRTADPGLARGSK